MSAARAKGRRARFGRQCRDLVEQSVQSWRRVLRVSADGFGMPAHVVEYALEFVR
ncbi:MAG: hypothetical protein QME79_13055 [Bacillota bacterium]|nr:hypothetical protein [Bacillota bacterium]